MSSSVLDVYNVKLLVTSGGHLAFSMLDFNPDTEIPPRYYIDLERQQEMRARGPDIDLPDEPYPQLEANGVVEDNDDAVQVFNASLVPNDMRRFSTRKRKKVEEMCRMIEQVDTMSKRTLRGHIVRTDPPMGRVMLK